MDLFERIDAAGAVGLRERIAAMDGIAARFEQAGVAPNEEAELRLLPASASELVGAGWTIGGTARASWSCASRSWTKSRSTGQRCGQRWYR